MVSMCETGEGDLLFSWFVIRVFVYGLKDIQFSLLVSFCVNQNKNMRFVEMLNHSMFVGLVKFKVGRDKLVGDYYGSNNNYEPLMELL